MSALRITWAVIEKHSSSIASVPLVVGILTTLFSGRPLWLQLGAVWFLGIISAFTAIDAYVYIHQRLPRRWARAVLIFLQLGSFSLAIGATAGFAAMGFWASLTPRLLAGLIFVGLVGYVSIWKKLSRSKSEALVAFLQTGGYALAAGSMAACAAFGFWASVIPKWLIGLMFVGVFMFVSSGLVHGMARKAAKPQALNNL